MNNVRDKVSTVSDDGGLTYLEQLTDLSGRLCQVGGRPYLFKVSDANKQVLWVQPDCGMWSCESCGAKNARRWIARVIDGCNNLPPDNWYFATITAHRKMRGAEASLKNIKHGWSILRKRWARRVDELYYVRVWEAHKDGSFHMHAITNYDSANVRIKDDCAKAGLGYEARNDEAKNAGEVAGYMAKYMLKSIPRATQYPKGARRIEVSRNWVKFYDKDSDGWRYCGSAGEAIHKVQYFEKIGYKNEGAGKIKVELRRDDKV